MNLSTITPQLAAMLYYGSPEFEGEGKKKKMIPFEKLEADKQKVFLELAETVFQSIDKLNLAVIPKPDPEKDAALDAKIHQILADEVAGFFKQIRTWKPSLIPQEELVSRLHKIFMQRG